MVKQWLGADLKPVLAWCGDVLALGQRKTLVVFFNVHKGCILVLLCNVLIVNILNLDLGVFFFGIFIFFEY